MSVRKVTHTSYFIEHEGQEFEAPQEPLDGTEIVHIEGDKAVVGYLSQDETPPNPREWDNTGTMVYWHRNYILGDVDGRKEYGSSEAFLRSLAGNPEPEEVEPPLCEQCESHKEMRLQHGYSTTSASANVEIEQACKEEVLKIMEGLEASDKAAAMVAQARISNVKAMYRAKMSPPEWLWLCGECGNEVKGDAPIDEVPMSTINKIVSENVVMLPLALLDHSGITMWVGSGPSVADPGGWDSGQVGWIYCTLDKAIENWGLPKDSTWETTMKDWNKEGEDTGEDITLKEATARVLEGEVKEFEAYITGEVYGVCYARYRREDNEWVLDESDEQDAGSAHDEEWGNFGAGYAKQELSDGMKHWIEEIQKEA